jgi:hypothetical protein
VISAGVNPDFANPFAIAEPMLPQPKIAKFDVLIIFPLCGFG